MEIYQAEKKRKCNTKSLEDSGQQEQLSKWLVVHSWNGQLLPANELQTIPIINELFKLFTKCKH